MVIEHESFYMDKGIELITKLYNACSRIVLVIILLIMIIYVQIDITFDISQRWRHSLSSFTIENDCVWLTIVGGWGRSYDVISSPNITRVVELSK